MAGFSNAKTNGVPLEGGTMSGNLDMNANIISNIGAATTDFEAATGALTVGASATAASGDTTTLDADGLRGGQRTTDAAPQGLMIRPQAAFAGGTQSAAHLVAVGGQDETKIDIDDYTQAVAGDTVTITTVDNTGTVTNSVFTESATPGANEFDAVTSNAVTATNLAAAINNAAIGVTAAASSAQVQLSLKPNTAIVTLAESRAAFTTVSHGTAGQMLNRLGAAATPAYSFAGDPDTGMYSSAANTLDWAAGGVQRMTLGSTGTLQATRWTSLGSTTGLDFTANGAIQTINSGYVAWSSTGGISGTADLRLERAAAGSVKVTGGADATLGKGQASNITMATQSLTFAANPGDASKVTSGLVPDGAILLGITTRCTTTGTNGTSVSIGDGTDVDMFGATTGITAGTTTSNADATAQFGRSPATAAMEVTITANGGNIFSGVWAVTAHYITLTAATSS